MTLTRRLAAEFIGSALLLAVVVGSGIMADGLAGGNAAIALLANSVATGAGLLALILMLGPISGAHFNPLVTLGALWFGQLDRPAAMAYVAAQVGGAFAGVAVAHGMFDMALFSASQHVRAGPTQWFSEAVATFGLLGVIIGCSRTRPTVTPFAVAGWIVSAYWFTASTSFANPAVTLARAASNTFTGIRPADIPGFLLGQLLGAACAIAVFDWLFTVSRKDAT